MSGSVVVLGSANVDLVLEVARIPAPGETVLCTSSRRMPGGKGANQAVAAARSGTATAFVGALGTDGEAELLRSALTEGGVDVSTVRTVDGPSGLAVVTVTPDGQNSIVVAAGANGSLGKLDEAQRQAVARADVLLCQLEIPLATVLDGLRAARNAGVRTVLNAAPSHPLSPPMWDVLDLLVVNEHEAADLADRGSDDVDGCLAALLDRVPEVVITLGADGSVYAARDAAPLRVAAPRVDAVDTTGAGDTFCGVLSASLAEGRPIAEALHRATAASSLSVQRAGAVPSIPTADEIDRAVRRGGAGVVVTATTERDLSVPRPIDQPSAVPLGAADDLTVLDEAKILAAPDDPADLPAWRDALRRWRDDVRRRLGYDDDALYGPALTWAAACRSVCLVWMWDERLYDRTTGRFTVEAFLAAGEEDFGGFDAVVLWHAYPVIGLDERNQWDFYRDVPDLAGLVARFHGRGVRVFCDYNPWDVGTRRTGRDDATELAALVAEAGFDGVFLDTLKAGAPEVVDALRTLDRPVALEGESRVPLAGILDHALSWAQWFADSPAPGVLRAHWLQRRHMMHHVRRWNRDHSAELQSAWVNGCGVLVWDDVFGVWVGWNARDRSTLRAVRPVLRRLGALFAVGEWTPLADAHPDARAAGVHAHRWSLSGIDLWTVVNRGHHDWDGPVIDGIEAGTWSEVTGAHPVHCDAGVVSTRVPARGVAGLVRVTPGATLPDGSDAAAVVRSLAASAPSQEADASFPARAVRAIGGSVPARAASAPPGAVVLRAGPRTLTVTFRRRETAQADETPWVDAWKPLPPQLHALGREERTVTLGPVAVDRLEVGNDGFRAFLDATGYRPMVGHRFLAHWTDGAPPAGTGAEPVTHVDLDDARAYAAWRGARLPSPAEWQAAAESGAGRRKPRVWNWTESERTDGVTRYALLKGGSDWSAAGSDWYVDGGAQDAEWELKLVLPGGGLQRSSRVGFRCAVDLEETT